MDHLNAPQGNSERKVVYTERQGNVKYTFYDDGLVRVTRIRKTKRIKWGRVALAAIVLILLIMGLGQVVKAITGKGGKDKTEEQSFVFDSSATDTASESAAEQTITKDKTTLTSAASAESIEEKPEPAVFDFKVCLDPGHGGYDSGVMTGEGLTESEKNLEFGLLVKKELESRGVEVVMTRTEDKHLSFDERCSIANEAKCDFLVSLHKNSTTDPYDGSCGTEVFINNASPEMDKKLATNILDALDRVGITRSLGVNPGFSGKPESNYQINTDTIMPSCQLELGYLTSDDDNALYESMKNDYAAAVADALIKTAEELGVIDSSGKRLIEGSLMSEGKSHIIVSLDGDVGTV